MKEAEFMEHVRRFEEATGKRIHTYMDKSAPARIETARRQLTALRDDLVERQGIDPRAVAIAFGWAAASFAPAMLWRVLLGVQVRLAFMDPRSQRPREDWSMSGPDCEWLDETPVVAEEEAHRAQREGHNDE